MAEVKLLSVNIRGLEKRKYSVQARDIRGLIDKLAKEIPGIKDELIKDGYLSRAYIFQIDKDGQSADSINVTDLEETIEEDDLLTIFPLITGG